MNDSCNIIGDLLPLYCDGVCSEGSKNFVEEHLAACPTCSEALKQMQENQMMTETEKLSELDKVLPMKQIKQTLFRKKVVVAIISIACTAAILFGLYAAAVLIEKPIKYTDNLVKIEMAADGTVDAFYQGTNYACAYGMTKTVMLDGKEMNIAYIYYTSSFWSDHLERKHVAGTLGFSIGNAIVTDEETGSVQKTETVDAVYYLPGDYTKLISLDNDEFLKSAKNAVLLWEK